MTTIDESAIRYVPGVLIKTPTNNNTPPAYGGTILGSGRKFQVDAGYGYLENYAVELSRINRVFVIHGNAAVTFLLRQWNDDATAALFPSAAAGVVSIPGTVASGTELAPATWIWAADRATDPSVIVRNAIPMITTSPDALAFTEEKELNVWVTLKCLPVSGGNMVQMAPIASLTI